MEKIQYFSHDSGLYILLAILAVFLGLVVFFVSRSGKKEYTGRIVFPVVFMELAFLFFVIISGFSKTKESGVGPEVVPLLWITGIFIFSIILLIQALTGYEKKDPEWGNLKVVFIYILLIIAYLILIQIIGYYFSTALFLIGGMLFLKYNNWKVIISLTAGWLLFSYFIFYRMLYVPLPEGSLITLILG